MLEKKCRICFITLKIMNLKIVFSINILVFIEKKCVSVFLLYEYEILVGPVIISVYERN